MKTFMNSIIWTALLSLVFVACAPDAKATRRPNIVILVADDLGFGDPGFRGSRISTPSIDRLAEEGMDLNRFYVAPICSPTRAALMTGRDPVRLGVAWGVKLPLRVTNQ